MYALTGIVLTGGQSRRMGRDKAFLRHGTASFAEIAADLLLPHCDAVCLVGGTGPGFDGLEIPHVKDTHAGLGPLGGILTAFECMPGERFFVLPCDLPLLRPAMIRRVASCDLGEGDVAVAATVNRVQPLVGIYSRKVEPRLRKFLQSGGRSVTAFLRECTVAHVIFENSEDVVVESCFGNINTPEDLGRLGAPFRQRGSDPGVPGNVSGAFREDRA